MTVMQCVSYAMSQLCKTTCLLLLNLIIYHIPASLSPATTVLCPGQDRSVLPMGWQHTILLVNRGQILIGDMVNYIGDILRIGDLVKIGDRQKDRQKYWRF